LTKAAANASTKVICYFFPFSHQTHSVRGFVVVLLVFVPSFFCATITYSNWQFAEPPGFLTVTACSAVHGDVCEFNSAESFATVAGSPGFTNTGSQAISFCEGASPPYAPPASNPCTSALTDCNFDQLKFDYWTTDLNVPCGTGASFMITVPCIVQVDGSGNNPDDGVIGYLINSRFPSPGTQIFTFHDSTTGTTACPLGGEGPGTSIVTDIGSLLVPGGANTIHVIHVDDCSGHSDFQISEMTGTITPGPCPAENCQYSVCCAHCSQPN